MKNERTIPPGTRAAWFRFKANRPGGSPNVTSFAAGWRAGRA